MAPSNLPVSNSTLLEYQQLITQHQDSFIHDMPKVEMHIHIEGSMTPELRWELAARHGDKIPNPKTMKPCQDLDELRELYKLLQDQKHGGVDGGMVRFFELYYAGFAVLKDEEDFYRLAMNYYERASEMNVRYCEPFFDPQGHTTRGVTFETMMTGFRRAQLEAEIRLNVKSRWVMCMLRDMSPESAMQHCRDALPYRDMIAGVGLDSLEENRPPILFDEMFRFARQNGWKITCHCDVGDKDTLRHIDQAVHHVGGGTIAGVDRIDHGLNAVEDASLLAAIMVRDLGMTICPWGYLCYSGSGDVLPMVRHLFDEGIKIAIGSDDPAYMEDVWLSNSLYLLRSRCKFTDMELLALQRNAVAICWAPEAVKAEFLAELSGFGERNCSVAKYQVAGRGRRPRQTNGQPLHATMLATHDPQAEELSQFYDNPDAGYYKAWNRLSRREQEAAEVFSIGKLLWCIFEGCADTRNSALTAFEYDSGQEFPKFKHTPLEVQQLIRDCTRGSKNWQATRHVEIIRRGATIFPRDRSGIAGQPLATAAESAKATRNMWKMRIEEMEEYLEANLRWKRGATLSERNREILGFLTRPTLADVFRVLLAVEDGVEKAEM